MKTIINTIKLTITKMANKATEVTFRYAVKAIKEGAKEIHMATWKLEPGLTIAREMVIADNTKKVVKYIVTKDGSVETIERVTKRKPVRNIALLITSIISIYSVFTILEIRKIKRIEKEIVNLKL